MAGQAARDCHQRQGSQNGSSNRIKYQFAMHRLNPIGKCYMTGIGFNRVHNPHDRESAYTRRQGWGPRPGILVFGPGGTGRGVSVPPVNRLARERKYIDNLGSIQWSEFTIYQSLCFPAAVYPVLGQGGKYDAQIDPFSPQQK
jgi:hypothetical protein